MLTVTEFVARTFDLDYVDLFWKIADFTTAQDVISAYTFTILRSESPEGPFDTLSPAFKDTYHFRDYSPNLLHKWRKLYYRLKVTHLPSGDEFNSAAASLVAPPDLIALEIQRQEDVLLREHNGRLCFLFPVRTFGPKCGCYDQTMGRRTRAQCLSCFDTGYLGGFLSPMAFWLQIDPEPNSPSNTALHGEKQPVNTSARLIAYPPIKAKDIIVEPENVRWRVVTNASTQRLRSVVHQELAIHEIPKGDVEYKLPINLADLTNQVFAAERNFTNPQHTGDQGETVDDLLAVYGYRPRGTSG